MDNPCCEGNGCSYECVYGCPQCVERIVCKSLLFAWFFSSHLFRLFRSITFVFNSLSFTSTFYLWLMTYACRTTDGYGTFSMFSTPRMNVAWAQLTVISHVAPVIAYWVSLCSWKWNVCGAFLC